MYTASGGAEGICGRSLCLTAWTYKQAASNNPVLFFLWLVFLLCDGHRY